MNLLPAPALTSINASTLADYFTKPLSRHRFDSLIGDIQSPIPSATSVATTTVVASTTVDDTAATTSDLVPTLHPNLDPASTLPFVLDTGASFSLTPFKSDFLSGDPFGLIRSATSVTSNTKVASKVYSTPVDPYTLITGEDVSVDSVDLSSMDSTDTDLVDTLEFATALEVLEFREFGTATLIFISDPNSELESILVEPTIDRFDWLDWIPLPRLTPTESYFHILGRDYLQALALFHLIPIWIALVSLNRSE